MSLGTRYELIWSTIYRPDGTVAGQRRMFNASEGVPELIRAHLESFGIYLQNVPVLEIAHEWRLTQQRRRRNSLIYPP